MGKAQYVSTLPRCSYNCTHIKTVLCGAGRRGEAAKRRRRFCSVYGEVVLWGHQAARPIFPHAPGAEVAVYLVSFMPLPLLGMLDDELFGALNGVMLGWAALAFLPRWRHTPAVTLGFVVLYSAMYAVLLLQRALAAPLPEGAGFGSLEAVVALFSDRDVVFAGWTHYIAFDLFVGRHIILDSQRTGLPHLAVLPLLPLTLMAGPAGLALYTGLKSAWSRWPRGYNPLLVLIYSAVTYLCLFMIGWVVIAPSSWLYGNSDWHDHMMVRTPPLKYAPVSLLAKYSGHRGVQFLHTLPSAVWAATVPIQLNPILRRNYKGFHRGAGWVCLITAQVQITRSCTHQTNMEPLHGWWCARNPAGDDGGVRADRPAGPVLFPARFP